MKYIAIIALFFAQILTCFAQNFEGKLVYDVHFEMNEKLMEELGIVKEDMIKKMTDEGVHFDEITIYLSKNGDYTRQTNAKLSGKFLYQASSNNIFLFEKKSKYITVVTADKYNSFDADYGIAKPLLAKIDSTKIILGDTCKLVRADWGNIGTEYYWYSDKIPVDAKLFVPHNYEYMNRVFELTNAYPMQITKRMRGFINFTMTLKSYEAIDLPDETFALPKMKKSKKKQHKRIEKDTGNQIMKIKS